MNSISRSGSSLRTFRGVAVAVLCAAILPLCAALDAPVTPNAQPAVGALLTFLNQTSGNYILSGQQERSWDPNGLDFDVNYIIANTGKSPVVRGFDFLEYVYSPSNAPARPRPSGRSRGPDTGALSRSAATCS